MFSGTQCALPYGAANIIKDHLFATLQFCVPFWRTTSHVQKFCCVWITLDEILFHLYLYFHSISDIPAMFQHPHRVISISGTRYPFSFHSHIINYQGCIWIDILFINCCAECKSCFRWSHSVDDQACCCFDCTWENSDEWRLINKKICNSLKKLFCIIFPCDVLFGLKLQSKLL